MNAEGIECLQRTKQVGIGGQSDCRQWNLGEASLMFSNVPHPRHGLPGCRRLLNAHQKTSCPIRPYYNRYNILINSLRIP
jgi:hypothetical protein